MGKQVTDDEFIELWKVYPSPIKMSKILGITDRNVMARRRKIEQKKGIELAAEDARQKRPTTHIGSAPTSAARYSLGIENGTVLVFSDAHFWPGIRSTAYKGLLWAIKELKPKAIINNGDAFDGANISRHPRIGWDSKPSVVQELHACEAALGEIEDLAKNAKLVWSLGNHDARFENRLANTVPEFMHVGGFKLADHFPAWIPCWSCWPTEKVVVKHRFKGGIHATHNNTVTAGISIVTGLGSDVKLEASRFAAALGIPVSGTTESQIIDQILGQMTIGAAGQLKGALSDKDREFLKQTIGTRGLTRSALEFVSQRIEREARIDSELNNAIQEWQSSGKSLNNFNFVTQRSEAAKKIDADIKRLEELRRKQRGG